MTNPLVPDDEARAWDSIRAALGQTGPLKLDSSLVPGVESFELDVTHTVPASSPLTLAFESAVNLLKLPPALTVDAVDMAFSGHSVRGVELYRLTQLRVFAALAAGDDFEPDDDSDVSAEEQMTGHVFRVLSGMWMEALMTGLELARMRAEVMP